MTRLEALNFIANTLKSNGITEYTSEAKLILLHVFGCEFTQIIMKNFLPISDEEFFCAKNLAQKRIETGKPLQYILNNQNFYGLDFYVDSNVLIPRFETEILVKTAIDIIKKRNYKNMLDMCTGSGCIAVSVKHELPDVLMSAADISENALSVAKRNGDKYLCDIEYIASDLFSNIPGTFDIITANPPYIPECEYLSLEPHIINFEPQTALSSPENGLFHIAQIAKMGYNYINWGGVLIMEVGYNQGDYALSLFKSLGYKNISRLYDFSGFDRIIIGYKE